MYYFKSTVIAYFRGVIVGATTFSIMTFSVTIFSILDLIVTLSIMTVGININCSYV